jgi:hypothetical protein
MLAVVVAIMLVVLPDHDRTIPVMPVQVPMPVSIAPNAADMDIDPLREDHRLVGNNWRTGERRGGQERDSK